MGSTDHLCEYCNKVYKKSDSLKLHLCRQKIRFQEQNDRGVQLGFQAYLQFNQRLVGARERTYKDFTTSPYYQAFVKWGKYAVEIRAIDPEAFVEFLLDNNKKIDQWCRDRNYDEYLMSYLKKEPIDNAIRRAIEFSLDWEEKTSSPSRDYLRFGNENIICYAISTGRISPWILYNCDSGIEFLNRLNPEQLSLIWRVVDTDFWNERLASSYYDRSYLQDTLKLMGW